ncbi:glycerophosphoryl diester phosphodiesterase membrane domain-containing protein [Streptomyces sp. NPDC020875]|uniref:glycerophosphoryl diester phosphodiesterase membrane domain-containing protein n=1 Tax=Streptomyces sp. NPDC020875 TaxID=3154898 RepID=UPI0033D508BC
MNDSPGRLSPGSASSEEQGAQVPRPAEPADQAGSDSKWSSRQPPAGQWSAPSAPGPYGGGQAPPPSGPGWGGPGFQGGWGIPEAPKPGVIPLRPLSIGELLEGAVSTLRAHWRTVLTITIGVAAVVETANVLVLRHLLPGTTEIDENADPEVAMEQAMDALGSYTAALGPMFLISLFGTFFTTALMTVVISRSVLGRPVSLAEAWREARPRLPQLLAVTFLVPLMGAAVLAVGILPGALIGGVGGTALALLGGFAALPVAMWLLVRFALAPPALMLERQGVADALRRSAKLVNGAWWRVFAVLLLTLLLTTIVQMVIDMPFGIAAIAIDGSSTDYLYSNQFSGFSWTYLIVTGVGAVIGSMITLPIAAGVNVLLYVDQRIRREGLDIELGRAAGLPGYGAAPPADAADSR